MEQEMNDKEMTTSLIQRYMDLQRIKTADDKDREIDNQMTSIKAQLEVCGVNVEELKIR